MSGNITSYFWLDFVNLLRFLRWRCFFAALGWIPVFFLSVPLSHGPWMMLTMVLGAVAGAFIGWNIADGAGDQVAFSGFFLIFLLVLASWVTIWGADAILQWLAHLAFGWQFTFGRWMTVAAATFFSLISAAKSELMDD